MGANALRNATMHDGPSPSREVSPPNSNKQQPLNFNHYASESATNTNIISRDSTGKMSPVSSMPPPHTNIEPATLQVISIQAAKKVERTILDYFKPDRRRNPASGKLNFFNLPFKVRCRIYEYAGLVDGRIVRLNYANPLDYINEDKVEDEEELEDEEYIAHPQANKYWLCDSVQQLPKLSSYSQSISRLLDGPVPHPNIRLNRACLCGAQVDDETAEYGYRCDCEPFPSQLMDVSPRLAKEIASLFFSNVCFQICRTDLGGMSILRTLSPTAFGLLTTLSIRLNLRECKCQAEPCYKHTRGHDELLRKSANPSTRSNFMDWERTCTEMSKLITPNQLKLSILTEVEDVEAAKEIVAPLSTLPMLRECMLWLSKEPTKCLLKLANHTMLSATTRSRNHFNAPFRFMDLPLEIQIHILRYTDLVTAKDLVWSESSSGPGNSNYFELRAITGYVALVLGPPYIFACCGECSAPNDCCYCWTLHSAASTTCTCWRMPGLFHVNRSMRELSISVFYSENHFAVVPTLHPTNLLPFEMLRFVQDVPETGRKYLRHLTCIFRETDEMVPRFHTDSLGHRNWIAFIDLCQRDLHIEKLTLTVDLSMAKWMMEGGLQMSPAFDGIDLSDMELEAAYKIGFAMMKYPRWGGFFLHMTFDWDDGDFLEGGLGDREEAVESLVMGDTYNAARRGKYNRRHKWNGYECNGIIDMGYCEDCDE